MHKKWTIDKTKKWQAAHPWRAGCNYIPSNAVNQLEMWQEETFSPDLIDQELSMAADLGMNALRIYLHDLAWEQDPPGFIKRMDKFLQIANNHGMIAVVVLFDDCWDPAPAPGKQPAPVPGVHNSRWVNSPGGRAVKNKKEWPRLKRYIQGVVSHFADDPRILFWDIYNELGNSFLPTLALPWYRKGPKLFYEFLKFHLAPIPSLSLFRETVEWVRDVNPVQPLTAPLYMPHKSLNKELIDASDIISFHNYGTPERLKKQIEILQNEGRPLVCTEYLNRYTGSTFEAFLPVFKEYKIPCFNWGLVSGKTQTIYPWNKPGTAEEPAVWFHDILRKDGTSYSEKETDFIKGIISGKLTAEK